MSEEVEDIKKTAEAYESVSEEAAKQNPEEATEKLLEKASEKEEKINEEEKEKLIEKLEEEDKEEEKEERRKTRQEIMEEKAKEELKGWEPKTKLGQEVKSKKIKDIDEIIENNNKILEPEIVDILINPKSDLISIGQSKGKFGGGKRRAWRQTQRKTKEGNVPTFSTMAVIGDENGHVGIGSGKAKETLPARDKAIRKAKLNVIRVSRTCSAFDCQCKELHTIPFEVNGKAGSVKVILIPAPQGTGLVAGNEVKKILHMAGIKDVYSKTFGRKRTAFNLAKATIDALGKTNVEDNRK